MRIDIVNNAEGFSEDKLNGLDEYIVKLSEAVLSGDYTAPQVTRTLKDAYATLTFVTPEEIKEINREQRDIDKETDCLSFPMLEFDKPADFSRVGEGPCDLDPETGELILGDIVISRDHIVSQAELYGHDIQREFAFLTVHSMLHLCGYDHIDDDDARLMEERQKIIMESLYDDFPKLMV